MKTKNRRFRILALLFVLCLMLGLSGFAYATKAEAETAETHKELNMYYDDHKDMSGQTVVIVDPGKPDSFQVGFGVEEETPDEVVLRLEGDTLIAAGTGKAQLEVDGVLCDVSVTAAPISLLLLIGQSNMEGDGGNASQSIVCPLGQVYSTYGRHDRLNRYTGGWFTPSALTGEYSAINAAGTTDYLIDYPVYSLNEAGSGKRGPDSGIAYEWVRATGEKVWVVNAAHDASSISTFQKYCENYEETVSIFSACQKTLQKEIAAGHYSLSHMGCFWCQGCSDANNSAYWYTLKFTAMYDNLKKDLSIDLDGDPETPDNTLEFIDIILAMSGPEKYQGYRLGIWPDEIDAYYGTFKELEMRGHRVGQLWMAANPELPEINIVSNLAESWVTMPDGSDGVEEYFTSHYTDGVIDYETQEPQAKEWYSPKTPAEVKKAIHYNQIGFNEVGIDAARNACILLGYMEDSKEETTIRFVDWTGYETIDSVVTSTYAQSNTLVVPIVSPIYRAKTITYSITDGLTYEYYDLLAQKASMEGKLCANEIDEVCVEVIPK